MPSRSTSTSRDIHPAYRSSYRDREYGLDPVFNQMSSRRRGVGRRAPPAYYEYFSDDEEDFMPKAPMQPKKREVAVRSRFREALSDGPSYAGGRPGWSGRGSNVGGSKHPTRRGITSRLFCIR